MKPLLKFAIIGICLSSANANDPQLYQTTIEQSVAQRIALLESQFEMQTVTWNLVLPQGQAAKLKFLRRAPTEPEIILELSFETEGIHPLLFSFQPGEKGLNRYTLGSSQETVSRSIPRTSDTSRIEYGQLDGLKPTKIIMVFLSADAEEPDLWVELTFQNK
jgi:hypothetical protein